MAGAYISWMWEDGYKTVCRWGVGEKGVWNEESRQATGSWADHRKLAGKKKLYLIKSKNKTTQSQWKISHIRSVKRWKPKISTHVFRETQVAGQLHSALISVFFLRTLCRWQSNLKNNKRAKISCRNEHKMIFCKTWISSFMIPVVLKTAQLKSKAC